MTLPTYVDEGEGAGPHGPHHLVVRRRGLLLRAYDGSRRKRAAALKPGREARGDRGRGAPSATETRSTTGSSAGCLGGFRACCVVLLVGSRSHRAWGRCGLSTVGRGWSARVGLGGVTHLDRRARLLRPRSDRGDRGLAMGPWRWRVWARTYRPGGAPPFCWVEGFLPVRGGFSSRTALKPSTHRTPTPPNPTDRVMDDCVSLGRPADREHVLSKEGRLRRSRRPRRPRSGAPSATETRSTTSVLTGDHRRVRVSRSPGNW